MTTWIDFAQLREFILNNADVKDDHLLWRSSGMRCKIPAYASNSKRVYNVCTLYFMYKSQLIEADRYLYLKRTCDFKNCIAHYCETYTNIHSVIELNCDQFERECAKFGAQCSERDPITSCINFSGRVDMYGYGVVSFLSKKSRAHRVAWELAHGESIPENLLIRHLCKPKNKLCVAPNHLVTGTAKENKQDEIDCGYIKRGQDHPSAKMSECTAKDIINSFGNGETQHARAEKFGVSVSVINSVDLGNSWNHLITDEDRKKRQQLKRTRKVTSREDVIAIRHLVKTQTMKSCAAQFGLGQAIINRIAHGKSFKLIHENKYIQKQLEDDNKIAYFSKAQERMRKASTIIIDEFGKTHWLFKNDASQNAQATYYQISIFSRSVLVHKASYMAFNQVYRVPANKMIRHKCLFKHCVNPDCLELGTAAENANDRKRDGTQLFGENNPRAKISEATAVKIKQTKNIGTQVERAAFFNTSKNIVSKIDQDLSWKHLANTEPDKETINDLQVFITESKKRKISPIEMLDC